MKPIKSRFVVLGVVLCLVTGFVILVVTAPEHPVALIRVVDANGKAIAGATILPEGLRTKDGPYRGGWYGWRTGADTVTNAPVITDGDGYARAPYPKFVFERIETGTLCLSVSHPDFVPDRPERTVATALPEGAPLKSRVKDLWDRVRRKALISRPDPVVLQQGATLKISIASNTNRPSDARLFAQVSGGNGDDGDFWIRPEPDVILTRRLAAGTRTVRAVMLSSNEGVRFSEVVSLTAIAGQTNELVLTLKRWCGGEWPIGRRNDPAQEWTRRSARLAARGQDRGEPSAVACMGRRERKWEFHVQFIAGRRFGNRSNV